MTAKQKISNEMILAARRELKRRAAKTSLAPFVTYTTPGYMLGWVHAEICETLEQFLQDVTDKKSPRLIICMPPRAGKSQLVSRSFPAYALGRYPDLQLMAVSYSADLSSRFNRDVQRIIDSPEYAAVFPDTTLSGQNVRTSAHGSYIRTSDLFEIVGHKGSYRSTGVGGGLTGMGADVLVIDDPLKDRAAANSLTIRNGLWDWYTSTAYTRLSAGGGVIVMCTRWHQDDLIGRLLSEHGETWHVINYPAIAEHDEPHRKKGEALHPERFDLETLERIKVNIGSHDWAALYQQHPLPEGGALFRSEWLQTYDDKNIPPKFDTLIGSWDMTFKDSAGGDYVVGTIWGTKGASYYLLDLVRGQWDFVKTLEMFEQLQLKWPRVSHWLIEDKANGSAIISTIKKSISGVIPITPTESKLARANAVSALFEAGNVYIPAASSWVEDYKAELLSFPSGAHDDQVDSSTQALNYLKAHKAFTVHPSNLRALHRRF